MDITINGYNIKYKWNGPEDGDVMVILQGWGTDMSLYDSMASQLDDSFRVLQFDLPGFGDSDEPSEAWSVDDYSDFFCSFMQALGVTKATLIGHSYGGRMIIKLAAREELPFEIDKIILTDSAGVMPKRTAAQNIKVKRYKAMRRFLTSPPVHALFPEVIDYWISKQGSEDYRRASAVMKACLVKAVNEDLQEIMPLVKQETLLIWGDSDLDTPVADGRIMEEKMPNAALVTIEGAGHYAFLEQPLLFGSIIRSFTVADEKAAAESVEKGGVK